MTTFLRTDDGEHAEDANFFNEHALLALLLALLAEEDEEEEEDKSSPCLPRCWW